MVKVRKQNGDELEPDTLTSYFRSFDRYIKEKGRKHSILIDRDFNHAREALARKRKALQKSGKGQKPNKAMGLSTDDIQTLWQSNQLGTSNPQVLLRTVWFHNTIFWGWRAQDEHHRVKFGDFEIKSSNGKEFVE